MCVSEARAVEINEDVAVFSRLKEYRLGALFHANKSVLDVCHSCEKVFRQLEPFLPSTFEPLQSLIQNCMQHPIVTITSLPTCYDMKEKLMKKYITLHLQILCKKN